jgi:6-phosphofructokinase 1
MDAYCLRPEELPDLSIENLGPATIDSSLLRGRSRFIDDGERILLCSLVGVTGGEEGRSTPAIAGFATAGLPMLEVAGPRRKIFFDPKELTCGVVTCGGLCPGLNDVVRTITLGLIWQYGVKEVLGFRYGYAGLSSKAPVPPVVLTPELVDEIHLKGGDILSSSRGPQDPEDMVNNLEKRGVALLFVIGGDGTLRGASGIVKVIKKRGLKISVIGVPKTIDNDIFGIERSFGFSTAVEASRSAILTAHAEAKGAWNGVGLVKLMGRESGFIAAYATLANSDVNFCFIPEVPFVLEGENGFLRALEKRLDRKHHAVIVVAEGVGEAPALRRSILRRTPKDETTGGEEGLAEKGRSTPAIAACPPNTLGRRGFATAGSAAMTDASGNVVMDDIGIMLKERITKYFKERRKPISLKYIDPSYMIRSLPADSNDSAFCLMLGQNAVHAGMSGRTNMVIGYWNQYFVHIPISLAILKRKKVDPDGHLWQTVVETTGQAKSLSAE